MWEGKLTITTIDRSAANSNQLGKQERLMDLLGSLLKLQGVDILTIFLSFADCDCKLNLLTDLNSLGADQTALTKLSAFRWYLKSH